MKNRIIVYVSGGNVQSIVADNPKNINVQLFDVDNLKEETSGAQVDKDWEKISNGMKEVFVDTF